MKNLDQWLVSNEIVRIVIELDSSLSYVNIFVEWFECERVWIRVAYGRGKNVEEAAINLQYFSDKL